MLHKGNSSALVLNLSQCPLTHSYITPSPSPAKTLTTYPPHYVFFNTPPLLTPPASSSLLSLLPSKLGALIPLFLFPGHFLILPPTCPHQDVQALPCPPWVFFLSNDTGNMIHSCLLLLKRELHYLMYVQGECWAQRQVPVNRRTMANRGQSSSGKPDQEDHQKHGLQPTPWIVYA